MNEKIIAALKNEIEAIDAETGKKIYCKDDCRAWKRGDTFTLDSAKFAYFDFDNDGSHELAAEFDGAVYVFREYEGEVYSYRLTAPDCLSINSNGYFYWQAFGGQIDYGYYRITFEGTTLRTHDVCSVSCYETQFESWLVNGEYVDNWTGEGYFSSMYAPSPKFLTYEEILSEKNGADKC